MAERPETKSIIVTQAVQDYSVAHSSWPPDEVQRSLIEATGALGGISMMQISPEQGAFMTLLTRLVGAKLAVEVGTFTGYSSICIARGLAEGGRLVCCDVSEEWTAIAREHWEKAGVADRIELRIGPAVETLQALPADPPIDLAFIDADKGGYGNYYEEIVARLRPMAWCWSTTCSGAATSSTRPTTARTPSRSAPSTTTSPPTTASRP